MGELVSYTIKGAILLSIMLAVYGLTMSRLKCAALRRVVLLSIYVCALVIPLLNLGGDKLPLTAAAPTDGVAWPLPGAPAVSDAESPSTDIYDWIARIAVIGIAVGILYFIACLTIMSVYHFRSRKATVDGHTVRVIKGTKASPFCFGVNVYVSSEDLGTEKSMILGHEMSHARHLHFIDLLIGRAIAILQWWNPAAWMMLRELHQVHEFQADEDVIDNGADMITYQYMLVGIAVGRSLLPLGSNMARKRLKSRLRMINRDRATTRSRLVALLMIPAGLFAASLLASEGVEDALKYIGNARTLTISRPESGELSAPQSVAAITTDAPDNDEEPLLTESSFREEAVRQPAVSPAESVKDSEVTSAVSAMKEDPGVIVSPMTSQTAAATKASAAVKKYVYMVEGRIIREEDLMNIAPSAIKSITVKKDKDLYPDGLVIIDLLSDEEIAEKQNNTLPKDSIN